jgi:hypothetical protein
MSQENVDVARRWFEAFTARGVGMKLARAITPTRTKPAALKSPSTSPKRSASARSWRTRNSAIVGVIGQVVGAAHRWATSSQHARSIPREERFPLA